MFGYQRSYSLFRLDFDSSPKTAKPVEYLSNYFYEYSLWG